MTVNYVRDLHFASPTDAPLYDSFGFAWNYSGEIHRDDDGVLYSGWQSSHWGQKPFGAGEMTHLGPFTTERKHDMTALSVPAQRSALERRREELEAQLAAIDTDLEGLVPSEPVGLGAVIRFKKWHGYSYAAIRTPKGWFITQDGSRSARQGIPPKDWDSLLQWIAERNWHSIEVLG